MLPSILLFSAYYYENVSLCMSFKYLCSSLLLVYAVKGLSINDIMHLMQERDQTFAMKGRRSDICDDGEGC